MKLKTAIQDALIALLCFDPSPMGSKLVRALVPWKQYDPYYREVAEAAINYIDQYDKPPEEHTFDLVEALGDHHPDEKEIYDRIYHSIRQTWQDKVNRDYVIKRADYFVREQKLKGTIAETIKVMQSGTEEAVDRAESLLANIGRHQSLDLSSGLLLNDPTQALQFLDTNESDSFPTGIKELDRLNLGPARGQLWLMIAPPNRGKSISPDCRVWNPEVGYRPMKAYIDKTNGGFQVLGVNRLRRKPKITEVVKVFPSGRKPICQIKLRSGRIINGLSDTHPILTWQGWTPCSDIKIGDFTLGANVLPLSGKATSQELIECHAVGLFLGDGCLVSGEPRLSVHRSELTIIEKASKALGSNPRISFKGNGVEAHYRARDFKFFSRWRVAKRLSKRRFVPPTIYQKGEESVAACLAGLFDTDGSIYQTSGFTRLEITTASYRLSEDLLTMLNVLGIYACRHKKRVRLGEKTFKAWAIILNDAESLEIFHRRVGLYGCNSAKWERLANRVVPINPDKRGQFYKRLPYHVWEIVGKTLIGSNRWTHKNISTAFRFANFGGKAKKAAEMLKKGIKRQSRILPEVAAKLAEYCEKPRLRQLAEGGFIFDEVVSIKWVGEEECWDMSTEDDTQSFLAEHVFTHNTWDAVHKGKTALRMGYKVCHISLEMSEQKIAQRYVQSIYAVSRRELKGLMLRHFAKDELGRMLRIEETKIKARPHFQQDDIRKILNRKLLPLSRRPRLYIKQFPTGTLTIPQLKGYLDHLEAVKGFIPDELIIDYPDLMEVDPKNKRNELGKLYVDIRGIAVERNIGTVAYSQSNRLGLSSKIIDMGKVAEDFSKNATADTIITFNQTDAEQELGLARLFVAKAREEIKHLQVLISQAYGIGQYCLDSALMESGRYWKLIDTDNETEEEGEDEETD